MTGEIEKRIGDLGAQELYRAVIEAARAVIFIVDASGKLVATNEAGRDLFGIGEGEHPPLRELLLHGHIRTIDGEPIPHGHARGPTSRVLKGETIHGEYAFFHARTGADITFRVVATPLRRSDGSISGAVMTMHDVSNILRTEREKEEFLSLVTHELKTPLTPLKTVAQLIRARVKRARDGSKPLDTEALERNVVTIERQVDRMDRLVTDLLEVSRIGRGKFELRPAAFDLSHSVREVVARWRELTAEEGRHTFELHAPASIPIVADQQRVEQVLMNLIGNAVKYSPRGGEVRVRVECEKGDAVVAVSDGGIGIPADEIAKMGRLPFERGKRAHGYAGVGIGLYLSRLIAQGHGGRVELSSEGEDKGTTARLVLPVASGT